MLIMEKWVPSEAVQILEARYDDLVWDYTGDLDRMDPATGWIFTCTVIPASADQGLMFIRRRYSGPPFWLKDADEAGPAVEIPAASIGWHCTRCEYADDHHCQSCGAVIAHMASEICPGCWCNTSDDEPE